MKVHKEFSIPILGLKDGVHHFNFNVDSAFFKTFENSPIKNGKFDIELIFDKKPSLYVLNFDIAGYKEAPCDRCLNTLKIPVVESEHRLLVKVGVEEDAIEDPDMTSIPFGTSELNVASFLFEYICLSLPFSNLLNCDEEVIEGCDKEVVEKYRVKPEEKKSESPTWDALKDLKL